MSATERPSATNALNFLLQDESRIYDDRSIGTSEVSELISKGSSHYSTISKNFVRLSSTLNCPARVLEEVDFVRNGKTPPNLESHDEKMDELMRETLVQYQIMCQASKALQYCQSTKEFISSLEHIEAERLLLLSSKFFIFKKCLNISP